MSEKEHAPSLTPFCEKHQTAKNRRASMIGGIVWICPGCAADQGSRPRQEASTAPEASALAPSQTERQTEGCGRSTDSNIQPKETPSLTLEGLDAKVLLNGFVWHGYHPTLDAERLRVSLEAYIDKRLAEIGLRHEAKDVELREASEVAHELIDVLEIHLPETRLDDGCCNVLGSKGEFWLPCNLYKTEAFLERRKALEGMDVEGK